MLLRKLKSRMPWKTKGLVGKPTINLLVIMQAVLFSCGGDVRPSKQKDNELKVRPTDCEFFHTLYELTTDTVFSVYNSKYRLLIQTDNLVKNGSSIITFIENESDTVLDKTITVDSFETALAEHHVGYGTIRYADLRVYKLAHTEFIGSRGHDLFFQSRFECDSNQAQYVKFQIKFSKERAGFLFMNAVRTERESKWK